MSNIYTIVIVVLLAISIVSSKMIHVSTIHTRSNAMNKDMRKGASSNSNYINPSRRAPYYFFVRTLAMRRPNFENTLHENLDLIETSIKEEQNTPSIEHHVHTKETFMISVAV